MEMWSAGGTLQACRRRALAYCLLLLVEFLAFVPHGSLTLAVCVACRKWRLLRCATLSPPQSTSPVIRVPPLTLARWPPEGRANNREHPANLSGPYFRANPLTIAGYP